MKFYHQDLLFTCKQGGDSGDEKRKDDGRPSLVAGDLSRDDVDASPQGTAHTYKVKQRVKGNQQVA